MNELDELYSIAPMYRELFTEQLQFILDPRRYLAAKCTRRAGKTTALAVDHIQRLSTTPNSLGLYLALTDTTVGLIYLPAVKPIIAKYKVDCQVNRDEIIFPNGSRLILAGANHINKIETFRGFKLLFCDIDEAGSFNETTLSNLIDEIIAPALIDTQGPLRLLGTPAPHCSGMFFDATTKKDSFWGVHAWSALENPHIAENFKKDMEMYLLRKQCDASNPKYRREYLGEWCADDEVLMMRQPHVIEKVDYNQQDWRTVIGVDIGFNDETAMTVVGWKYNNPQAYVLESIGNSKQSVSDIAHTLQDLKTKYKPSTIVVDPAGASRTLMEEFSRKYHIHTESAKKTDKAHYIELLNDALINKELLLVNNNTLELQREMKKVVWNEDRTREQEGMKCDRLDATLYAFRAALHFLEKIPVKVVPDANAVVREMEEQAIALHRRRQEQNKPDQFYDDLARWID